MNTTTEKQTMLEIVKEYLHQQVFQEYVIHIERFQTSLPSLCIKGVKDIKKRNKNILGEYTGEFSFGLMVRIAQAQDTSIAYRLVEDANVVLEQAHEQRNYPTFGDDILCEHMEMTSHPVLVQRNEDNSEDYIAIFTITFRKVSKRH